MCVVSVGSEWVYGKEVVLWLPQTLREGLQMESSTHLQRLALVVHRGVRRGLAFALLPGAEQQLLHALAKIAAEEGVEQGIYARIEVRDQKGERR